MADKRFYVTCAEFIMKLHFELNYFSILLFHFFCFSPLIYMSRKFLMTFRKKCTNSYKSKVFFDTQHIFIFLLKLILRSSSAVFITLAVEYFFSIILFLTLYSSYNHYISSIFILLLILFQVYLVWVSLSTRSL